MKARLQQRVGPRAAEITRVRERSPASTAAGRSARIDRALNEQKTSSEIALAENAAAPRRGA
jgi:hypothetical protein